MARGRIFRWNPKTRQVEEITQQEVTKTKRRGRAQWPIVSAFAGVQPSQIEDLKNHWKQHDVRGCEVLPNGDVVWNSPRARFDDCRARGLYDRNAGYSDPAPLHR